MNKKIGILYFSPTGSGEKIANEISKEFDSNDVTVINLTPYKNRQNKVDFNQFNFVFFVFPVYAGRMPNVLKAFLLKQSAYNLSVSTIAVWGNVLTGNVLLDAKTTLERRGFKVVSGAEIVAPHSYNIGKVKLGINRPTSDEISKIKKFAKSSVKKNSVIKFPKAKFSIISRLPQSFLPNFAMKVIFDKNKCSKCGVCRNVCPVNAINENFEIDINKCIKCLACVRNCPTSARKKKYKNPIPPIWFGLFSKPKENKFYI